MARVSRCPQATRATDLEPVLRAYPGCCTRLYAVYRTSGTVTILEGVCRLTLQVIQYRNPDRVRYRCPISTKKGKITAIVFLHIKGTDAINRSLLLSQPSLRHAGLSC